MSQRDLLAYFRARKSDAAANAGPSSPNGNASPTPQNAKKRKIEDARVPELVDTDVSFEVIEVEDDVVDAPPITPNSSPYFSKTRQSNTFKITTISPSSSPAKPTPVAVRSPLSMRLLQKRYQPPAEPATPEKEEKTEKAPNYESPKVDKAKVIIEFFLINTLKTSSAVSD